jgi:hypothetical protein
MRSSEQNVGIRRAILVFLTVLGGHSAAWGHTGSTADQASSDTVEQVKFDVRLDTPLEHDDGQFLWFHPRVSPLPRVRRGDDGSSVLMTLQKHLRVSDFYSGAFTMQTDDLGASWRGPDEQTELAWVHEGNILRAVADITPGWHAPTGKVIAVGALVRYSQDGAQLEDIPRAQQTAYAVYDPQADKWSAWQVLDMPPEDVFNFARSACAQWMVQPDGTLLLPFYIGRNAQEDFAVAVVQCTFDGSNLRYLRHGSILTRQGGRGLCEPSVAPFRGKYYLTLRNDQCGYVTVSDDGLDYVPIEPWRFDDGAELGSYNTQQHWLTHDDGMFLVYTRRGAGNDHVMRHRAPLFIAQVDPLRLRVIRATERVLIPERGATLGNFGAAPINEQESWVTVCEGVWSDSIRQRGATGALFVARVLWSKPNTTALGIYGPFP